MARLTAAAKRLHAIAAAYAQQIDSGRAAYNAADELLDELLAAGAQPGDVFALPDGRHCKLLDSFAAGNKAFRPCAFARYSLKIFTS